MPSNELITDNDLVEESIKTLQNTNDNVTNKVFLNPTARDTLLSNLANGNYNSNLINIKNYKKTKNTDQATENVNDAATNTNTASNSDMTVATRDLINNE